MTLAADQVEVTRMAVRGLVAGSTLTKIDLARNAGFDHPLQRAVHSGAADSRHLTTDEIEEIVRTQMTFLLEEDPENLVAFGGMLPACRTQTREVEIFAMHG